MFNRPVTEQVFRRTRSALSLIGLAALIVLCLAGISLAASIKAVPSVSAAGYGETFAVDIVVDGIPADGLGTVQFRLNASAPSTVVTGVTDPSLGSPGNISFVTPLAIGPSTPTLSGIGDFFWNARSTNGVLFIDNETFQNGSALYSLSHTNGAVLPSGSGTIARFLLKVGATVSSDHISITLSDVALLNGDVVYPLDAATGVDVQLRCKTTVPSLLGLSNPDAISMLTANQLVLGNIYELDNTSGVLALSVVLEQSIPSGNSAFCGDPVNLAINTPPAGSISINGGAASTNTLEVTLALGCTDAISGCSQMIFSNDNKTWTAPETYSTTKTWQLLNGDGQKTVYVKYKDGVGNASQVYSAGITLATIPPVTTATPAGGLYKTAQTVTLSANEPATIYYTTDGTMPTTGSSVFSGPISIAQTTTIRFFAVSTFGNAEGVKSATFTIDNLAPGLTISALPDGSYSNNAILNIAGTASDANGIQSVVVSGQTITTSTSDNINYTFSQAISLSTGSNTVTTVATDNAGNTTTDTRTINLDQTAPQITITNPADNSVVSNPSVTVSGTTDKTATILISLNNGPTVIAASNATTFSLPITLATNTINTIIVYATDLAGNSSAAKRSVTHDDTKPALAIMNPNQDMGTNRANVTISGTVSDLTDVSLLVTCPTASLGLVSTPTSTTWSVDITNMQQGTNAVTVQATDQAGNSTSVVRNIIYTQTPITIDSVRTPTNNSQQQITGTMELNSTVTSSCSTAAVGTITYPTTTTWQTIIYDMTEGANIISATATDLEGHTSDPVTATIILDTHAPDTIIQTGPAALTSQNAASFSFISTEQGSTFECRLDNGTYSPCVSPMNYSSLIDGTHTFMVRATDPTGNTDQTPASFTWKVDTIPPVAVIIGVPPSLTNVRSALLTVTGDDVIAYQYKFDLGVFSAETSTSTPIVLSGLLDGPHKVLVTGKDSAGNWQKTENATPASWTVDITPPALIVSTLPNGSYTNNPVLNVAGTVSDANGIQSVIVSGQTVTPVTSDNVNYTFSQAVSLATGSNTITTTATDNAGNPSTDTRTIILDRNAPVITITNPADNSLTNKADVDVTGFVNKIANVSVKVNGVNPLPDIITDSTFTFPVTLAYNLNHIDVTAVDLASNTGSAVRTVTLDNLSPALAITNPNQDMGTDHASITISGTVSDLTSITMLVTCPTASIGVVSRPTSTTWSTDITNLQQGTNAVKVQATDEAGNSTSVVRNIIFTSMPVTVDPLRTPTNINHQTVTGTMELASTVTVISTATVGTISYPTPTTWQTSITGMTEGANIIRVMATDLEGNTSNQITGTIMLDTTPPTTTPSPAPGTYYNTVTVTLGANEPATIYYTIDGTMPTATSAVYNGPLLLTATTTLKFFAFDMATNAEAVKSVTYTVIPDTAPPVTTITAGSPNYTSGGGQLYVTGASQFMLSATDNVSGVATTVYRLDGGIWTTYASPFSLVTEGSHTFGYRSTDSAANVEIEKNLGAVVDNTPPVSTISIGAPPVTVSTPISITATDTASGVRLTEYAIDGGSWTTYGGAFTLAAYSQGTHTVNYRSTDNVTNVETTKSQSVQLWTERPTITTASLADGTTGTTYSQTLTATGATPPYTWSISVGTLPAGLALTGTTGIISGTPTSAGTSTITFQVSDVHGMTNTKVLSVSIYSPISITTGTLATGTTGTSYSQTLAATGGKTPYAWSISVGTLPSGLSLNSSTGVISGTPTSAGTSTVTFRVTDANNGTNTKALALAINSTFYIATATLASGTTGTTYSQTLTATGGKTPYTWSLTSGSLPAGLSLKSTTGVISGTPTTTGTSTFTVQVKDANNATATKSFSITIYAPVSITTTALASGITGSAYNQTLAATGGKTPYAWSISVGTLPSGLSLNSSTGVISGTPTSAGTSTVTFRATDANNSVGNKALGITIYGPPGITTSSLPAGTTGTAYSQTLAATGGKTPYTWSITTGSLPVGLSLAGSTGVISGTPTTTGTSTFTVQVKDANNTTSTKTLSISIYAPLVIGTSTLPAGTRGAAYSQTLTATGGKTPYAWSISSGNLPAGLTLNSSTGVISGTPTTKGTSSFTVKVTDANAITATKSLSITVN